MAEAIAAATLHRIDARLTVYDLIDIGPGLGAAFIRSELSDQALEAVEAIEQANALIAVSPVYKGSFTGLFKHLFDFVSPDTLFNKPVVIGATGGGHQHGLMVEHQLRPLFGFFSALTVPTAVYASESEFVDRVAIDPALLERIEQASAQLALLLRGRQRPPLRSGKLIATAA